MANDDLERLMRAVDALPEAQRRALLLREREGRSYDEIAAELGVGRTAVARLLLDARSAIAGRPRLRLCPRRLVSRSGSERARDLPAA
jgi:RNA polymerase sigma factor (sigma-70 family)